MPPDLFQRTARVPEVRARPARGRKDEADGRDVQDEEHAEHARMLRGQAKRAPHAMRLEPRVHAPPVAVRGPEHGGVVREREEGRVDEQAEGRVRLGAPREEGDEKREEKREEEVRSGGVRGGRRGRAAGHRGVVGGGEDGRGRRQARGVT